MKSILLVLFGICCISLQQCNAADIKDNSLHGWWQDFKIKDYIVYVQNEEKTLQKALFKINMNLIKYNEKISEFTDMTDEEIKKRLGFGFYDLADLDVQWQDYKSKFNRVYETIEEDSFRKEMFKMRMVIITENNEEYSKMGETFEMGVNTYTDMTAEEIIGKFSFGLRNILSRGQAEWNDQWHDYKTKFNKVYETPKEDSFRKEIFKLRMMMFTKDNEKYSKWGDFSEDLEFVDQWQSFKSEYNKHYATAQEEKFCKDIFRKNLEKINEHNENYNKNEVSFSMGINEFTDITFEEFKIRNGVPISKPSFSSKSVRIVKASENADLPKEVDWVKYGFVQNVSFQGSCASCYAMAVTAAIEGHWYIKHKEIITLSQQELVDCSFSYGNMGCQYGEFNWSFKYIFENGIGTRMKYPYIEKVSECKRTTSEEDTRYNITSWVQTKAEDEVDLKRAVANGPVIAIINPGLSSFQHYMGGVYYDKECSIDVSVINHAVLIVGYGTSDKGEDYWLIKNSWGSIWGMNGYMRIARNRGNQCGIATVAIYPIL